MEHLGDLIGIVGSVFSGGLLGVVGAIIKRLFAFLQAKRDMEFERAKMAHELELQKLQIESRREEGEREIAIAGQAGSYSGLTTSIQADAKSAEGASQWVINLRSLTRPALTVLLVLAVMALAFTFIGAMRSAGTDGNVLALFSQADVLGMLKYLIYSLGFSAATAVAWWFGDRPLPFPGGQAGR